MYVVYFVSVFIYATQTNRIIFIGILHFALHAIQCITHRSLPLNQCINGCVFVCLCVQEDKYVQKAKEEKITSEKLTSNQINKSMTFNYVCRLQSSGTQPFEGTKLSPDLRLSSIQISNSTTNDI